MRPRHLTLAHQQRGVATLIMALIMLLLIAMITAYTSNTVLLEQKISNNDYRARQALEYAESGIATAVEYISQNPDRNNDNAPDRVFDTNNDGIGNETGVAIGNGFVTVTVTAVGGNINQLQIVSTGLSDDRTASRAITQVISTLNSLPIAPGSPLTSKSAVVINGSATVTNPEGSSTIWSGDNVNLGANNATATNIANMTDANYPGCMDSPMTCSTVSSSNRVTIGLDVIEHDSSLSNLTDDQFFQNFFGLTPANYREAMDITPVNAADAGAAMNLSTNEILWVDAGGPGNPVSVNNITFGCSRAMNNRLCTDNPLKPSIVIIDGDLDLNGSSSFYGVVFVTGNLNVSGNNTFYGAVVAGGTITSNVGGSLDIFYHSGIVSSASGLGPYASSSGSWRDF